MDFARGVKLLLWLAAPTLCAACRTAPLPPLDTTEPGWSVQQGQAIWRRPRSTVELAGELLVATHADGRALIQFAKTPLPLVEAQTAPNAWQIRFSSGQPRFAGRGEPPTRFLWLQLPRALLGEPGRDRWKFQREASGRWRLESIRTGETIEGYLAR